MRRAAAGFGLAWAFAATAASAQTAADSVVFTFAWPIGLEGNVEYTHIVDRVGDTDTPTHLEITGEYEMHVHDHPSGILIEHLNPVAARFRSSPTLRPSDPRRIVYSTLGVPLPDWVVSRTGEFVQIQGLEALRSAIADAVTKVAPGTDVDAVIGTLASPDPLYNSAVERWRNMVGDWIGAVLRVGEMGSGDGTEANPVISDLQVSYRYQFKLNGMKNCPAPGGRCAEVELSALYDPTALNQTMNDALQRMGMTNVSFDGLAEESRMILLTDPKTLLPYQMDVTKGVEGILKISGESRVFRRMDETSLTFRYRQ